MSRYDHIIEQADRELADLRRYCGFRAELLAPRRICEAARQAMRSGRPAGWHSPYYGAPGETVGYVPDFAEFRGYRQQNQVKLVCLHVKFEGRKAVTVRTTRDYPYPHGEVNRLLREGRIESFQFYSRHCFTNYAFDLIRPSLANA